jgi:hypothetical protein
LTPRSCLFEYYCVIIDCSYIVGDHQHPFPRPSFGKSEDNPAIIQFRFVAQAVGASLRTQLVVSSLLKWWWLCQWNILAQGYGRHG